MKLTVIKTDIKDFFSTTKGLEKKIVIIFIAIAVLQTVSWYFTSRAFFRVNIFKYFIESPDVYLYEYLYWFLGDFLSLGIFPLLIIVFLLREKPKSYGVQIGDYKRGILYTAVFLTVMIVILWFVSAQSEFSLVYPHYPYARNNWQIFLIYEAGMLFYMAGWEFIWRGFTLFGLWERFSFYAILIQMIPFVILHNGKPPLETFSSILGGIGLGILAYKTKSVLYCIIVHFGVMFTIDLFSVLRFRASEYGVGFNSLLNLINNLF